MESVSDFYIPTSVGGEPRLGGKDRRLQACES